MNLEWDAAMGKAEGLKKKDNPAKLKKVRQFFLLL